MSNMWCASQTGARLGARMTDVVTIREYSAAAKSQPSGGTAGGRRAAEHAAGKPPTVSARLQLRSSGASLLHLRDPAKGTTRTTMFVSRIYVLYADEVGARPPRPLYRIEKDCRRSMSFSGNSDGRESTTPTNAVAAARNLAGRRPQG